MSPDQRSPADRLNSLLATGRVELEGRMPWSSNATFLVTVVEDERRVAAIYKPARGERPLWDFPGGLFRREVAAYDLSEALGWQLVPPTVEIEDGPLGPGSLQAFIDADFEEHYFTLLERPDLRPSLRRMATFDVLANNADRKSGHCLIDRESRIWGIDHGVCFHAQYKLRTVIWDFAGEPLDAGDAGDIERFLREGPPDQLAGRLRPDELEALLARARRLLRAGVLPEPKGDYPWPWPAV